MPGICSRSSLRFLLAPSPEFLNNIKHYVDPTLRCKAQVLEDFSNFNLLLEAFRVRVTRSLLHQ